MPMLRKCVEECSLDAGALNGIVEKLLSDEGEKMRESIGARMPPICRSRCK